MPFVPLTPQEQEQYKGHCDNFQHNPPGLVLIPEAMKWVCPQCGRAVIVGPTRGYAHDPSSPRIYSLFG